MLSIFFVFSFSLSMPKKIIEDADLLLDMMEYRQAMENYLNVLKENPDLRDIRKNIGYAYFQLDMPDEALKFLNEELTLFPDNEDAYDILVYVLYKLDKLGEAHAFPERSDLSVKLTADSPFGGGLGCFIQGMYFKNIEMYDEAKIYFRRSLEKGYDPVKCYAQLIDIDFVQKESATEIELKLSQETVLFEAVREYGAQPEFLVINGVRLYKKSKPEFLFLRRAVESFEEALRINPHFQDALFNLGRINYNSNNFENASEYFKRILEIDPENDEATLYAKCCLKKLDPSAEIESISEQCPKTIELSKEFLNNPDMEYQYQLKNSKSTVLDHINNLGHEFVGRGRFQQALKRFRNGLKIDPESPIINFNAAIVYSWLGFLKSAERHALIALRRRGIFGSMPAYRQQEILREEDEQKEQKPPEIPLSRWTFETALEEGNYFIDAYNSLGTIYFKRREFQKSILAFKKVTEIHPEDAMAHYNLGCAYQELNDLDNAEESWKRAVQSEKKAKEREERTIISNNQLSISLVVRSRPVSFRSHMFLGRLYIEKGLPDLALKEYESAIELETSDPEPYYELGRLYQAKSQQDKKYVKQAISHYERYLYQGGEKEKEVKESLKLLKKK